MFTTVLVPVDGTPQAAAALPLARTLAHATAGSLVLVRVARDADIPGQAEQYLQSITTELQEQTARWSVRHGRPVEEILAAAQEEHADLIVMATHGRSGLPRLLAGSVSERVVTESRVPVVLMRPGGKRVTRVKTLLVPTDGTAGAALALGTALGLARATGARLVLVQAIEPVPLWVYGEAYGGVAPTYIDPAWEDEALEAATKYIDGLAGRLQSAGVQAEGRALKGVAVATIEAVADQTDADLIVMSTHALTGPARTLLGSTADALVRTAERPVLLVRRRSGQGDFAAAPDLAAATPAAVDP